MVTLAVKSEPVTPKVVGDNDEDPEHDVNVAAGVEIFKLKEEINVVFSAE